LIDEIRERPPDPVIAKAIREAAGVSQARLARELGVSRVTIARWETGARRPGGEAARAYSALLDQLREVARR
jgi:DNA-binding transcriptional regulator YiaG